MMQGIVDTVVFFGRFLNEVNPIILRLAMREDKPEWLRERPKLPDLPRWSVESDQLIRVPKAITPDEVGDHIVWIVENLHEEWCLTHEGFMFSNLSEAIHYKLRWG
jgi:hypothetical protein